MTGTAKVTVDTKEADKQLSQLRMNTAIAEKNIMTTVKKGYQSLLLLADIMGVTIPLWFTLMSQAALAASETFAILASAETISGWMAVKAAASFAISVILFQRAIHLQRQSTEAEQKLAETMRLINMWSLA